MANYEIYPEQKLKANKQTVWEHYFARQIALKIAPVFVKMGVSANFISFLSVISGIAGAAMIMFGNFWLILSGSLFIQIWLILDKTDGVVARLKKSSTKFGEFFEEFNGSLVAVLFFLSVGFASFKFPGYLSFDLNPFFLPFLGIFTSLFVALRHLMTGHFKAVFGEKEDSGGWGDKGFFAAFYSLILKFSGVYSLAQPIFLLAVIFNFLGLYTVAYFLIQGALLLANMTYLLISAGKK